MSDKPIAAGALSDEKPVYAGENRNVLFTEGDWHITVLNNIHCLAHHGCQIKGKWHCSCGGRCSGCKTVAPDEIVGFLKLVKYGHQDKSWEEER